MESEETKLLGNRLFPVDIGFIEKDYLAFLAQRVPKNLVDQLDADGQPDIELSKYVNVADLVKPLSSGVFPVDNFLHMTDISNYILLGYGYNLEKNLGDVDPYKVIYVGSLHLHCYVSGGGMPTGSCYLSGIHATVNYCFKVDVPSRLQVCRFLASLVPKLPASSTDDPAPLSALLLGLSLITGSALSDMSEFTEHVMKSEFLSQEEVLKNEEIYGCFREEHREGAFRDNREYAFDQLSTLKETLVDIFGVSGKVRQGADRFMLAVEDQKENLEEES